MKLFRSEKSKRYCVRDYENVSLLAVFFNVGNIFLLECSILLLYVACNEYDAYKTGNINKNKNKVLKACIHISRIHASHVTKDP